MDDLILKKEWADIKEVKGLENKNTNCLRVYCTNYPDGFNFQIRTFKPITDSTRKGFVKKRAKL